MLHMLQHSLQTHCTCSIYTHVEYPENVDGQSAVQQRKDRWLLHLTLRIASATSAWLSHIPLHGMLQPDMQCALNAGALPRAACNASCSSCHPCPCLTSACFITVDNDGGSAGCSATLFGVRVAVEPSGAGVGAVAATHIHDLLTGVALCHGGVVGAVWLQQVMTQTVKRGKPVSGQQQCHAVLACPRKDAAGKPVLVCSSHAG
jgi:hypothetical protein